MKDVDALKTRADFLQAKNALKDMLASEGWALYIAMIGRQKEERANHILLEPLNDSPNAILQQEFKKGEYQAYAAAERWPETMIVTFAESADRLPDQETKDE